jgi:hypothetical protein
LRDDYGKESVQKIRSGDRSNGKAEKSMVSVLMPLLRGRWEKNREDELFRGMSHLFPLSLTLSILSWSFES